MYAYDHMLVTGGEASINNLIKTDLFEYLLILRDLGGPPNLPFYGFNMGALVNEALKDD